MVGTPRGLRDILPSEALARERISEKVRQCFSKHGYLPVETPMLEEHAALERGGHVPDSPFRLFDSDGGLLVLRPDITLAIARMVATRIPTEQMPLRLRYKEAVVREESSLAGQPRQFTHLGVELVGGLGVESEVEVVSLLAESLATLEIPGWLIVCGSVTPLNVLLDRHATSDAFRNRVLELVHDSDLVGLDQLIDETDLAPEVAQAFKALPRLSGGAEVLDELDSLLLAAGIERDETGSDDLRCLVRALSELAHDGRLRFDFSIINSFDYYTGVIFKGYAEGITAAIASGGRYDAVFANHGLPDTAACGFMLTLERLQEVLGEQGESGVVTRAAGIAERPLRIAVPKGALFKDAVALLAKAGLPVEELENVGRRLIIRTDEVEYLIVRAQDAPTFVAHGGADCGLCGSDSIIEANVDVMQLVDLHFGECRFVVAEPASAKGAADEAYAWRGSVRVATKYPRITKAYYDARGQQVDIVQLHGNIELGPIVGMAERIIDITQTGATLEQNDLVIVDDVMECSARFFAVPAAYRSDRRIKELAARLDQAVRDR